MTDPTTDQKLMRLGGFFSRLSLPLLAAFGVVLAAGVGGGGYYAYRTYDYVQHDNDFCMSCHLMEQPYEQFAESAHRGLGCKACHQPNLIDRSAMAFTQVIENPEEITVHAEVPNERCADCHIKGDPEKWRMIANSVGHRIHLESDDPSLEGLKCVECHSTSVHEFAPVDRTCAQSGCHENSTIKLGKMGDLTIHCAACHNFVAPVTMAGGSRAMLEAVILPDHEECFSCHVMRTLVQMPSPDPHRGVCSSCHNPHVQQTPAEAGQTCASAQCHTGADTLTTFHRGLEPGALENCTYCHKAHDFSVDGTNCLSCHTGILEDSPEITLPNVPSPHVTDTADAGTAGSNSGGAGSGPGPAAGAPLASLEPGFYLHPTGVGVGWDPPQSVQVPTFLHSRHRDLGCGNCHTSAERHGQLLVTTLSDCRRCHHTDPVSRLCSRCHEASDAPTRSFTEVRRFELSVGTPSDRRLPFVHEEHVGVDCATCHTEGLTLNAQSADCASCHAEHHDPETRCASCHQKPPVSAHPPSEAHVTCSGAGCHQAVPFDRVPRTREVCLGCHQDMRDHRPDRACAECHTLPAPRGG